MKWNWRVTICHEKHGPIAGARKVRKYLVIRVCACRFRLARQVSKTWEGFSGEYVARQPDAAGEVGATLAITDEEMKRLADQAQPYSEFAKAVKDVCGGDFLLPPAIFYMAHVDSCIASIGAGTRVDPDYTEAKDPMASARHSAADYRQVLSRWLSGWQRWQTKGEFLLGATAGPVVDEVYDTLGDVNRADKHQKSVIDMMVRRLDPLSKDLSGPEKLHERLGAWDPPVPANTEERFFHDITRLDLDTWKIIPNVRAMIRNVAASDRVAEVHCWIGNPENISALRRIPEMRRTVIQPAQRVL